MRSKRPHRPHVTCSLITLVVLAALSLSCGSSQADTVWSLANDFSFTQNPNGAWRYGWVTSIGGSLNLYNTVWNSTGAVPEWQRDMAIARGMACKNVSGHPVPANRSTQYFETGMAALHPGEAGELCTVRWTAPSAALVSISARFTGQSFDGGGTTTDVHVVKNGVSLFDATINGYAGSAAAGYTDAFGPLPAQTFETITPVAAGNTIDFCVGYGNGTYFYDITAVEATITARTDGGLVTGTVTLAVPDTRPAVGAIVRTADGAASTTTNADGSYSLIVPVGSRTLEAVYAGMRTGQSAISVTGGSVQTRSFTLYPDYGPTYFVSTTGSDSSDGRSPATAWRTIANGDARGILTAGDTVLVAEGTYPQADYRGVRLSNCSGGSTNPINYKAVGRVVVDQTAVPKPTSTSCGFDVSVSGVKIDGFVIVGCQWGIRLNSGTSGNTIANCVIRDALPGDPNSTDETSWCGGVMISSSSDNLVHHNRIYNIGDSMTPVAGCIMTTGDGQRNHIYNNTLADSTAGVYALSNPVVGSHDAINNIITGMSVCGIDNGESTGCTGSHNLFHGNTANYGQNASAGEGDMVADPAFTTDGGYHLQSHSPAIDAGADVGFPCFDSKPDIGAFEYMGPMVSKIGYLKNQPQGTPVDLAEAKVVTCPSLAFADHSFCVEEPDRASGIKLVPAPGVGPVSVGDRITFTGSIGVDANGERVINVTSINSQTSGAELKPIGMTGRSILSSVGLSPVGLLVKTCGWVTYRASDGSYVYIDDGSGADDGSGRKGVRITLSGRLLPPNVVPSFDQFITVTGLLGRFTDGAVQGPTIRPRVDSDIMIVPVTRDEMTRKRRWVRDNLEEEASTRPFSFTYGEQPSAALLETWTRDSATVELDEQRTERTLTFTDPDTGLQVRCVSVEYRDYPTVEWTVYLKNTGSADTGIVENLQALDAVLTLGSVNDPVLCYNKGSYGNAQQDDYQPLTSTLQAGVPLRLGVTGGRPTEAYMPYFNLSGGDGGIIVVIGWPGQWASTFTRGEGNEVRIVAGQELTRFRLLPGEEVRTPLVVVQFHDGDVVRSQNVWRRWMIDHNIPRPGGQLPAPRFSGLTFIPFLGITTDADEFFFMDKYLSAGIQPDVWWLDAGWYQCNGDWVNTGTWEIDTTRHPNGLKTFFDVAHANNMRTVLWFEPERVTAGSWLANNHQDWLLGNPGGWQLLNLGNPNAWNWLVNHIDSIMTTQHVDDYRSDFNISPLPYWRANDAADRQGITEIKHVMGYLALWDELRRRHPNMLIDSCASGGRRNDLESMRRAVPQWRSDYRSEPIGTQGQTYGISSWIPYSGVGAEAVNTYTFRSNMTPCFIGLYDVRNTNLNLSLLKSLLDEWRAVSPYYYGDYYPLTPYSLATNAWMAWQFDRPDMGQGMVQAFRRSTSASSSITLKLGGLDPAASYTVTNLDNGVRQVRTGQYLMEQGLAISLPTAPSAALYTYSE